MSRGWPATLIALACAAAWAPATAGGAAGEQRIAAGVSAGGVDLSGLTVGEAADRLRSSLAPAFAAPVVVQAAGRSFTLTPGQTRFSFDPERTARRAYQAGLGLPVGPAGGTSGAAPVAAVALAVRHSSVAVARFVEHTAAAVRRAPRNARLRLTVRHVSIRRDRPGVALSRAPLAAAIDAALDDPGASRTIAVRRRHVQARVTAQSLARSAATVITIDRDHFRLRLFKNLHVARRYSIAVGMSGLETPRGVRHVLSKQVNPAWHVPNRPWAGVLAGQTIPYGDPRDPLKARFIDLGDGVGIHGTAEDWSIGRRASHGCIRMHVGDVIDLYRRVPLGTPVLIR